MTRQEDRRWWMERLRARRLHSLRRSVGIFSIPEFKSPSRLVTLHYSGPDWVQNSRTERGMRVILC